MGLDSLERAIRLGAPHPALRAAGSRAACPSAGRRGARFGRRGGGAAPWTPLSLGSKLTLWLDEREQTTTGSGISDWQNQAGAAVNFVQGTDASRPPASTVNGYAAPDFDGSADRLDTTSLLSDVAAADAFEGWAVVSLDALGADVADASAGTRVQIITSGGTLQPRWGVSATTSGIKMWLFDGAAVDNTGYAAISTGATALVTWRLAAGTMYARVNADAEVSAAGGPLGDLTRILRIGTSYNAAAFLNGRVASVGMCNAVLSTGERASLRSYLGAKYAVTV